MKMACASENGFVFAVHSGVEIRCIVIAQHKCFSPNASDVS